MAFHNRIRLPINVFAAQFGSNRTQSVKADGTIKILNAQLKKTYQLTTDWMPELWHQRLVVALSHSNVSIEGEKYFGGLALDGTYQIDWDEQFRTPVAGARVQVAVTPFDESTSNCLSCDEAAQLSLVDDVLPDPLDEDSTNNVGAAANDNICCTPVTFSITSFNSTYVDTVSIDPTTGVVSFHVKTGLVAANGLVLITYRATCFNGGYDEANIIGDINGTIPGCLAPTFVVLGSLSTTTVGFNWTAPSPAPDHYLWQILSSPGGVVLQSGDTTDFFIAISGLTPNTPYTFQVASECDPTDGVEESNFIQVDFTTPAAATNTCGRYRVFYYGTDPTGHITYIGCDGFSYTAPIDSLTYEFICALQSSPGIYNSIDGVSLRVTYDSEC